MSQFLSIAQSIGKLVERKNAAYGSSFEKAGSALRLLYPDGIAPAQLDDALLIARIWDKLMRIATDRDALGGSPFSDIAGYGILGVSMHSSQSKQPKEGVRVAPQSRTVSMSVARMPQSHNKSGALLRPALSSRDVAHRAPQKNQKRTLPALRKKHQEKPRQTTKGN